MQGGCSLDRRAEVGKSLAVFQRLLLLILCCAIFVVQGEVSVPWTLEKLTHEAELVMHARVVSTTCAKDDAGRIFTEVEVEPIQVFKGEVCKTPKIVHSGGIVGEEHVVVIGQVSFEPGEEFLGFLVKNERGELVTLGMNAGKLTVTPGGQKSGTILFGGKTLSLEEVRASISNLKFK